MDESSLHDEQCDITMLTDVAQKVELEALLYELIRLFLSVHMAEKEPFHGYRFCDGEQRCKGDAIAYLHVRETFSRFAQRASDPFCTACARTVSESMRTVPGSTRGAYQNSLKGARLFRGQLFAHLKSCFEFLLLQVDASRNSLWQPAPSWAPGTMPVAKYKKYLSDLCLITFVCDALHLEQ